MGCAGCLGVHKEKINRAEDSEIENVTKMTRSSGGGKNVFTLDQKFMKSLLLKLYEYKRAILGEQVIARVVQVAILNPYLICGGESGRGEAGVVGHRDVRRFSRGAALLGQARQDF